MLRPRPNLPEHALEAVPADAAIVAEVEIDKILSSQSWSEILLAYLDHPILREAHSECKIDPLRQFTKATIFARPAKNRPIESAGFFAKGDLDLQRLGDCAEKIARKSSVALNKKELDGLPSLSIAGRNLYLASIGSQTIVGGSEHTIREILSVAQSSAQSLASNTSLDQQWNRMDQGAAVTVAIRLGSEWRHKIHQYFESDRYRQVQRLLSNLDFALVSLRLEKEMIVGMILSMQTPDMAGSAQAWLETEKQVLLDKPLVSLSSMGGILRKIRLHTERKQAIVNVQLERAEVDALLRLFFNH